MLQVTQCFFVRNISDFKLQQILEAPRHLAAPNQEQQTLISTIHVHAQEDRDSQLAVLTTMATIVFQYQRGICSF